MTMGPVRILVTGFGGFPGVAHNPTERMVAALRKHRSRLARLGVALELDVLPVVYAEIAPRLQTLAETIKPDAVLHFGLAARRKGFCIETRALNRVSLLRPDAAGARARFRAIVPGAAFTAKSTFPSALIAAAMSRAGIKARLSINAGDYVCNQTLYLSLALMKAGSVGFIHIPRLARRRRTADATKTQRPTLDAAVRAAVIAILVMAVKLRGGLARNKAKLDPELDPAPFLT